MMISKTREEERFKSLRLACSWLTEVAQVRDTPEMCDRAFRFNYSAWRGCIRGEYSAAKREWDVFCPVWHTGQAVKALVLASHVLGEELLTGARLGVEFILNSRVTEGRDKGLILAYEDHPDKVNISAVLECLDGLFLFAETTGKSNIREAALEALDWVRAHSYMKGDGLFRDLYNPDAEEFMPDAYGCAGRPLLDDAVFVTGYRLTGNKEYLDVAVETAERLLRDENPAGNWLAYPPCNKAQGKIHPRHAYWWGYSMLEVYKETGDKRFLACFQRSADWYCRALRRDGGLFRGTYEDFTTDSFGHATSGVGCAALMFLTAYQFLGDQDMLPHLERALGFCSGMQFKNSADKNLQGAVLEKVLPPDGTDASPYHLRDLGTIFYVSALSRFLASDVLNCGKKMCKET
jgi:hypothetical protein